MVSHLPHGRTQHHAAAPGLARAHAGHAVWRAAAGTKGSGKRQLPWNTAIDSQGTLARSLGVQSVPALLVLDANGRIRAASVGYTSEIGMRLRMLWVRMVQ